MPYAPFSQRISCQTPDKMVAFVTDLILRQAQSCVQKNDVFRMVLSGGTSPLPLYKSFGASVTSKKFPWEKTEIFWGDERQSSPKSSESNYGLAAATFLHKVPLAPRNIHPMHGETNDLELAAQNYEFTIANSFGLPSFPSAWDQTAPVMFPSFDIILLGMGPDGHTASIFPNSPALTTKRWIVPVPPPVIPPRLPRLTMTASLLCAAKIVVFLVSARSKRSALDRIFSEDQGGMLPAGCIQASSELYWVLF